MIRSILIYGLISGLIIMTGMITGIVLADGQHGGSASMFVGYLIMLVALSSILVAVKQYRDRTLGGVIRFWPALLMGLGIAAVAGVAYVAVWEVYLAVTDYAFMEQYAANAIEAKRAAGATGAELEKAIAEMEAMKVQYANPLFRLPITFSEVFPVGLLIALVSAALLRNPRFLPARAPAA